MRMTVIGIRYHSDSLSIVEMAYDYKTLRVIFLCQNLLLYNSKIYQQSGFKVLACFLYAVL